jgi:hypothetical protein
MTSIFEHLQAAFILTAFAIYFICAVVFFVGVELALSMLA